MKRIILLLPLIALISCSRYQGPREIYQKNRSGDRPDNPNYTLDEQQKRGRASLAATEDDYRVGPKTYTDPGPLGR